MGRTGRGGSRRSVHEQHHRSSGERGRGGGRGWCRWQAERVGRCEPVAGPELFPHLPRASLPDGGDRRGAAAARGGQRGGEPRGEGGGGGGVRPLLRETAVRTAARTKHIPCSAAQGGGRGGSARSKEEGRWETGGAGEGGRGGAWRVPVAAGSRRVSERFAGGPSGGLRVAGDGRHAGGRRAQSGHPQVCFCAFVLLCSLPHHPHTPPPHPCAPFPESSGPVSSSTAASIRS